MKNYKERKKEKRKRGEFSRIKRQRPITEKKIIL